MEETNIESFEAKEAIAIYEELKKNHESGDWSASPVEEKNFDLREFFIRKKGVLDKFRRTYLVAGRHNFPDSPRGGFYTEWGMPGAIPLQLRLQGKYVIFKMILKMFFYRRFNLNLSNLEDTMIGAPVPQSIFGYKITDTQIRSYYYKEEIKNYLGKDFDCVLEVGGGFGALSGELLLNNNIKQYFLVELFDAIPLASFYLKKLLGENVKVQILSSKDSEVDPNAKVIILPPDLMNKITSEVSLFINTMSFQHMSSDSINYYLQQASRLKSKYIFLNNRDWVRDPTDLIISEYPIPNNYKEIISKKWLYGKHTLAIHQRD